MLLLKPSQIYYSQDSISNTFDNKCRHSCTLIGETLDDICDGRCSINDIPTIRVCRHNGRYVTADNRRLWVFRKLEKLGKCSEIYVVETYGLPEQKLTSVNGGIDVRVRGSPGGYWHNRSASSYSHRVSQQNDFTTFNTRRPTSSGSYGSRIESNYSRPSSSYSSNNYSSYRAYSPPRAPSPQRQNDSWCTIL